jgi:hypothetical protein
MKKRNYDNKNVGMISILVSLCLVIISLSSLVSSIEISDFKLILKPEKPNPGDEIKLKITSNNSDAPQRFKIQIYAPDLDKIVDTRINLNEEIMLRPQDVGIYKVNIEDYEGLLNFSVKKELKYGGPNPQEPTVGDSVTLSVPAGVGVKVLDSLGNVYLTGTTKLDAIGRGIVNFTIGKAGKYMIVIGEYSREYWGKNISLNVREKGTLQLNINPKKAIVEKVVTLLVKSEGAIIEGAKLTIMSPDGGMEEKITSSSGEIIYVPKLSGIYLIKNVEKSGYKSTSGNFSARNAFEITIKPNEPEINESFLIKVKNQLKKPVPSAKISIEPTSLELTTNIEGEATTSLSERKEYTLVVKKEGYWDKREKVRVISPLKVRITPKKMEIGKQVKIDAFDIKGNKVSDILFRIKKPNGEEDNVESGEDYEPMEIGIYEVTASKAGYKEGKETFEVEAYPLEVEKGVIGKKVIISVTSHAQPISGIPILVETPFKKRSFMTNEEGIVEMDVVEGEIKIYTNVGEGKNSKYKENVIRGYIKKGYSISHVILMILLILLVISLVIAKPWKRYVRVGGKKSRGKGEDEGEEEKPKKSYLRRKKGSSLDKL